jgi:hypothetical protein
MSKTTIPRGGITADAIDATLIADDAISEEHLDATAITGHTALAEAPADTDEFLISDGGVLKRLDASHIGGGALTYINGASSTSEVTALTLDNVFSSTYQNYLIVFGITVISGSNGKKLLTRVRHGGSTVTGSSYHTSLAWFDTQVTGYENINYSDDNSNNASSIQVGGQALSNTGNLKTCAGTITLFDMNKSDEYKTMLIDNVSQNWSGYTMRNIAVGQYLADQAIDGITFFANSDNLREGYFRVYGIANS